MSVLPLKIFLEYQRNPLTTQSMVPPCLINNKQGIEMLCGTWPNMLPLFKQLLHTDLLDFSHKPAVQNKNCACYRWGRVS